MDENSKVIPLFPDEDARASEVEQAKAAQPLTQNWRKAFRYLIQSAMGKYTLESYLETLGEFTDGEIRTQLENGLNYCGGEASFATDRYSADVSAAVCMRFRDGAGQWQLRKAERLLPKSMFTQETVQRLEDSGELRFGIYAPEET